MSGDRLWPPDSDRVSPWAQRKLAEAARILEAYAPRGAVITGHTDGYGQRDDNRRLSAHRAKAVKRHLIERYGIAGERLEARGMGKGQPIASNETGAGHRADHRIAIQILG